MDNEWFHKVELPPVGTVCQFRFGKENNPIWENVEILFHHNDYAIFSVDSSLTPYKFSNDLTRFKPVKASKEVAIENMLTVICKNNSTHRTAAEALYAAGYRNDSTV